MGYFLLPCGKGGEQWADVSSAAISSPPRLQNFWRWPVWEMLLFVIEWLRLAQARDFNKKKKKKK